MDGEFKKQTKAWSIWGENLRKCPETEFRGMLDFYGIKIGDKNIRKIIVETKGGGTMSDNINRGAVLPFALGFNFDLVK